MASSKATIWMTFAAAAGTLAVVIGVIAGPSLIRCNADPAGLLACMRGEVVDAGLLPQRSTVRLEPPPLEPAPPPTQKPGPTPETAAPAKTAPAEPTPVTPAPVAPDVNLVRAEPDGQVIIAGTGTPGIEVEVFANGDLVGKVMAEASGDWVLLPDRPLAVGTAEISVGATGSNERSPHTFTVTIPADKVTQPTITTSGPVPPVSSPPTEPPLQVANVPETAPAEIPPAPPEPQPVLEGTPAAADVEPRAAPEPIPVPPGPEPTIARAAEPIPAAPEPVPPPPATSTLEAQPSGPAVSDDPRLQLAETPPAVPPVPPPTTAVPPQPTTIDAIEIDGTANYFAGAGPEGATVRLYVQDEFIASATVEGGRWLVEAHGALKLPTQRVRIDLIEPQQGDVSARAEVNFVVDVPAPAPQIEATAEASGSVTPPATAAAELAVTPAPEPQPESQLEVAPAIPTLRATPTADPQMLRFASGKAIIRRGETLWEIAERVYGDGNQYRRIVEANESLISSPGRIFPGQVFDLPKLQAPDGVN